MSNESKKKQLGSQICFIFLNSFCRYMFWADCGANPAIERARLDGSERTILLNRSIAMPHGLSIDYETDRLYWCDKKLGTIGWLSISGNESHTIAHTTQCMSLTVYKEHIYWVDR